MYETSLSADVEFEYEIAVGRLADIDEVVVRLDRSLADYVGDSLIDCDGSDAGGRRRMVSGSTVDGLDPSPMDAVVEDGACKYFLSGDGQDEVMRSGMYCLVVKGYMTLYLREDTASSSTLESSTEALKALALAMNGPDGQDMSPFIARNAGSGYSVAGVRGIRYVSGTPDEGAGGSVSKGFNGGGGLNGDPAVGLATGGGGDGADETRTSPLSTVGITLIAIGGLAAIALAFLVALRVNRRREAGMRATMYAEFDDGGLDLKRHDDDETDVDSGSGGSGEGYDDDDTIFAGLDQVVEAAPGGGEEGYECGFPPPARYEPKAGIERPRYENPSSVTDRRAYHEDNTVEF